MTLILSLKPGADVEAFLADAESTGLSLSPIPGLPRHFTAPGDDPAGFALRDHPAVEAIEDGGAPARGAALQPIEIDAAMQGGSWAIARHIRRDVPWRAGRLRHPIATSFRCARDGAGVDAYVVDTGIRYGHQEFGGRARFVGGLYGEGGVDDYGHGTAVSSCLAGATVGLARGAALHVVKGLDSANAGTLLAIASAIGLARADYVDRAALDRPAVLNLSLYADGATVASAVADCIDAGMVVVVSAGNEMSDAILVPATVADVICVGGIKANDTPYYTGAHGTNHGSRVDLLAAAERVWTAGFDADDAYRLWSGTSFAAPLVSGAVACMLQGRGRLAGRAQVQAVRAAVIARATAGRLTPQPQFNLGDLPDRILWLDPDAETEIIPGLD